jgi:hypothetical protein
MPNDDVTVTAKFLPFTAMRDLKINNRALAGMADGKTDYTLWIPARIRRRSLPLVSPPMRRRNQKAGQNIPSSSQFLENTPIQYTVKDPDGITKTTYTFRIIREIVPTAQVPSGTFVLEGAKSMEITKPFRIGTYEVVQEEWSRVMGYGQGKEGDGFPANGVTWYEAIIFCNKLSMLEQKTPVYSLNNQTNPDS